MFENKITAGEAKILTAEGKEDREKRIFQDIMKNVKRRASNGRDSLIYDSLTDQIREKLRGLGYTVNENKISWE